MRICFGLTPSTLNSMLPWCREFPPDTIHTNPIQSRWNLAVSLKAYLYSSATFYKKGVQNLVEVTHYLDFLWLKVSGGNSRHHEKPLHF
ncbi:MAG: hypothetical protein ACKVOU_02560 [Cytophagales bacterium]